MRLSVFIILTSCLTLLGCEDRKKTSEEKTETTKEITQDSVAAAPLTPLEPEIPLYPKLTNENVVAFLTKYGEDHPETKVTVSTYLGDIHIELYKDTPLHRANFIYLTKQKYFENTFVHRIAPGFIIQAGNSDLASTPKKRAEIGKKYRLPAEISSKRNHQYGSVCGAKEYRENPDKKSAPFEFYIFIGEPRQANHLNGDYTIFGKVTKGMDVVEAISKLPADKGEWPKSNVYIEVSISE